MTIVRNTNLEYYIIKLELYKALQLYLVLAKEISL